MEINLEEVSVEFDRGHSFKRKALTGVSLVLMEQEATALIGPTGSGKSTLLRVIAGLLKPTSGRVKISKKSGPIVLSIQEPHRGFFAATVWEEVQFGPENQGLSSAEISARVEWALAAVELPVEKWEVPPFLLSGGEQRRVALASAIAMKPRFLLLDEPTIGLDRTGKESLVILLKKIRSETKMGLLIASHEPNFLYAITNRVLLLEQGVLRADTTWGLLAARFQPFAELGLELPLLLSVLLQLKAEGAQVNPEQNMETEALKELRQFLRKEREGVEGP